MERTIEEQFFKTFGIEPKWKDKRVKSNKTTYTAEQAEHIRRTTKNRNIQLCYPEITDAILLRLVCMYNDFQNDSESLYILANYEKCKTHFLEMILWELGEKYKNIYFDNNVEGLKHSIRALFSEVDNEYI